MKPKQSLGPTAQKVLLLLLGGLALGLSRSPRQYFKILKAIGEDWKRIDRHNLHRTIKNLYHAHLVDTIDNPDGSVTMILTQRGKEKALIYQIDEIKVKPMKRWDGKWRLILFDIPEHRKKARDAFARTLKNAGFHQFQKSVFVHPFECQNEIDFIIEFFKLRPYVRVIIAERIDNELELKRHFKIH